MTTVLGDYLKWLRKLRRLTQEQLGAAIGKNQPYISKIEKGRDKDPSVDVLRALARTLDVPLHFFALTLVDIDPRLEADHDVAARWFGKEDRPDDPKGGKNVLVPRSILERARKPGTCFAVTAYDNAMLHEQIRCGDHLLFDVVEESDRLEPGEIVLILGEHNWWISCWRPGNPDRPFGRFVGLWRI